MSRTSPVKMLLLAIVGVSLVTVALWLGVLIREARQVSLHKECTNNLKQIGLGLHNYHDTYLRFPPAHLGQHSWRVRLNPFMISSTYYSNYDFDEPWNSEWNHELEKRGLPAFADPDETIGQVDPTAAYGNAYYMWQCPTNQDEQSPHTNYLMLVGPHAFGLPDEGRSFDDITDDHSTTIAVAETASRNIEWLEPKDFDVETMSFQINDPNRQSISSHHPGGAHVLFCDGTVVFLTNELPPKVLQAMITIDGGEKIIQDDAAPGGYRLANETEALEQHQ